jgi:lysosomal acid lipase/cholesteryl ester hydrolase
LHRAGYDVWMGNNRGNAFSTNHTHLPTKSKAFWNFTFDEMGRYDLPAMVSAALSIAKRPKLNLIAWSQGNTQTLIAGSDPTVGPFLAHKIGLWIALSPVSFLYDSSSTLLTLLSRFHLAGVLEAAFPYGILQGGPALSALETLLCKLTFGALCKLSVDLICGVSAADSTASLERLTAHFPAGCSVKDLNHYENFVDHQVFRKFNYGAVGNREEYGTATPPPYNMSHFQSSGIKLAIYAAGNDDLVNAKDLLRLESLFPPSLIQAQKLYDGFSHVTWMVGTTAAFQQWGGDVLNMLEKHVV